MATSDHLAAPLPDGPLVGEQESTTRADEQSLPFVAGLEETETSLRTTGGPVNLRGWSYEVATGRFRWAAGASRAFALSPVELERLTPAAFLKDVHPDDRAALWGLSRQALARQMSFTFRYRFLPARGEQKLMVGHGESQVDATGKVSRVIGTVLDVTEHERLRAAAEATQARMRAMTELSPVWVWEQDDQFRFTLLSETRDTELNKRHAAVIGKCRWELPGCTPCRGTWDDHLSTLRARAPFHDFEIRIGSGPGVRFVSATGVPAYGPDGLFIGYRGTAHDITALKTAQAKAQQNDALLRLASRLGRVGAWALELPNLEASWSSELLNIYELEAGEALSAEQLVALAQPDWRSPITQAMQACESQGIPVDLEFPSLTARGRSVWLRITAEAVTDDATGAVVRIQGAVQDVTDRKADAERLRLLSEQLTTTFESITDAFVTVDRELRFTYVNSVAERASGLSRDRLLGTLLPEQFATFDGSEFQSAFARALTEDKTVQLEAYAPEFDKWLNVTAYPSAQGLALFIRDVTERRNFEQALVQGEERYRLLFETSADGILKVSVDGRICRANRAACEMFGRSEPEMLALLGRQLVSPADARLESMIATRVQHGGARGELTMLRADGSVFEGEVNTSTFTDSDGAVFLNMVVRDITARIQLRRRLIALNEELTEKVRQRTRELERANGELRGFAHSLAHDLRQPIAAAKSFGHALEMSLAKDDGERARRYASQLTEATRWMGQYVEALLSLTKISQAVLAVENVDLSALASGLLEELRGQGDNRHALVEVQPGLHARGDRTLLRVLLQNLLGNAWKFTGRSELPRISFAAETLPEGEVVYSVEDNGAGFDMSQAERLFETFQRFHSSSQFPGTGIGLATAHKIVGRHGGRIWAESQPDQGAKFFFTLGGQNEPPGNAGP